MRKLLVLGASEFQIPLLKQAKEMGIYTCVLDVNPNAYAIPYADEYIPCSLKDEKHAIEIAKDFNPDGVTVGMCDVAVCTCAKICEELGLPGLSSEVATNSTNKKLMIEAFRKYSVPHPEFIYFKKGEFSAEKLTLEYPIICKPVDMAGSRGINLVLHPDELECAINDSIISGDSGDVIVEEYMIGPEVSVELFVENYNPYVLQITDKYTSGPPHFIELGHSQPSELEFSVKGSISEVACAAARALGLHNCVAHAEIIITNNGPKMVEIGARMGGDGIQQQLLCLSAGINLPEMVIRMALGEEVRTPEIKTNYGSAIRFIPAKTGVVSSVNVSPLDDERIKTIRLLCKPGDKFKEVKDNSSRYGYVIAQADTVQEAIKACEAAAKRINVNTYE